MRPDFGRRRFLFLQGPPGPFFWRLGQALRARGNPVFRVNLNGGDRHSWPATATDYRGSATDWPRFFDSYVCANWITDLVLFGDCRPLHAAAHALARARGLAIHVFEEGYIRPDWVTLEPGGVNGHSTLSRDPAWYLTTARNLPPVPDHPPIPFSFRRRAGEAIDYYTHNVLQRWRFPGYRSHRQAGPIVEGLGWLRRFASRSAVEKRSGRVLAALDNAPFYVFPLQLDSDAQVRIHSPFTDVRAALDFVVESFARNAPAGTRLLVKAHPLDNGLTDWRRATLAAARDSGAADRVLVAEDGDIARLVAGSRGVVTINSTTGTLALGAGVPTIALGDAVYDVPGITHQGALDDFWQAPTAPDPELWDAFRRVLIDRCLVRGGFLSEEGLDLLIAGSVERLTRRVPAHG